MALTYQDILQVRNAAQQDIITADSAARHAARLIRDRLRIAEVDAYDLVALKRELKDFDAVKREWKPRK